MIRHQNDLFKEFFFPSAAALKPRVGIHLQAVVILPESLGPVPGVSLADLNSPFKPETHPSGPRELEDSAPGDLP